MAGPSNPTFVAVSDAEGDMRSVYDDALILYDYLSSSTPINIDRQGSLCRMASHLLRTGADLRMHCSKLYEAAKAADRRGAALPAEEPTPISRVDVADKLSVARNLAISLAMMANDVGDRDKANALAQIAYNAVDAINDALAAIDGEEGK